MKDREVLNSIYEIVNNKSVPTKESFIHNYDRSDVRLINETQTASAGGASSIEATAPENVIDEQQLQEAGWGGITEDDDNAEDWIQNADDSFMLDEEDDIDHYSDPDMDGIEDDDYIFERGKFAPNLEENQFKERLALRKQLNEHYESEHLQEEIEDEKSPANLVRYQLQKFSNGGTQMGDGQIDGEEDGPSSYEAWRYAMNDKKRKARAERENLDRDSEFASPRHTIVPDKLLDGQSDEFLYQWMKDRKQPMTLNEKMEAFINDVDHLEEAFNDGGWRQKLGQKMGQTHNNFTQSKFGQWAADKLTTSGNNAAAAYQQKETDKVNKRRSNLENSRQNLQKASNDLNTAYMERDQFYNNPNKSSNEEVFPSNKQVAQNEPVDTKVPATATNKQPRTLWKNHYGELKKQVVTSVSQLETQINNIKDMLSKLPENSKENIYYNSKLKQLQERLIDIQN